MMKKLHIFLISALFLLNSCDIGDGQANFYFVPLQIVSVDLPDTFVPGQVYEIGVTYLRTSTCIYYEGFDVTAPETTTRVVVAIGSEFQNQDCAEIAEERDVSFNFEVLYTEPYVFRFWAGKDENGEDIYQEYTVPVEE